MTATFERPWSQLSIDEQRAVRRQMTLCAGVSVNGVAGWYSAQRSRPTAFRFLTGFQIEQHLTN